MRIVLNTHCDDAATRVCIHDLAARLRGAGVSADVGRWDAYGDYDVAVFMGYDDDLERARAQNPRIRVVLADPKLSRPEWARAARAADVLLVSSVEQRDAFLPLNRNAFVYYMFPEVPQSIREHTDRERLVVAYHGNRIHLEAMRASVAPALEQLARDRPIELVAIYDVRGRGRVRAGLPDPGLVPARHVQWTPDFHRELARADIGIVPSELPIRGRLDVLERSAYDDGELAYEPFDHLLRFKVSTNPGRMFPFARVGVPVVSDFTPSAAQFVLDGVSGFLASGPNGWYEALAALSESSDLRTAAAAELLRRLESAHERGLDRFLAWCERPLHGPPPDFGGDTSEQRLARLERYPAPRPPLLSRVRRRFRRAA